MGCEEFRWNEDYCACRTKFLEYMAQYLNCDELRDDQVCEWALQLTIQGMNKQWKLYWFESQEALEANIRNLYDELRRGWLIALTFKEIKDWVRKLV